MRRWQERPRVYLLSRRLVRRAARYGSPSTPTVLVASLTLAAGGAPSSAHTSGSGTGGSVVPSASSIATPSDHGGRWVDESFVAYGQSLKADVGLAIGPTGACDPILGTTMLDAVRLLDADAGPGCVCRWPSGDDDDQLG